MANLTRLKAVRSAILEYPENFNYKCISGLKNDDKSYGRIDQLFEHNCNTCGCVAGFTCSLAGINPPEQFTSTARDILELDCNESDFLFFASELKGSKYLNAYNYPPNFNYHHVSNEEGVIEALRRLDFIIEHYSKEQSNVN